MSTPHKSVIEKDVLKHLTKVQLKKETKTNEPDGFPLAGYMAIEKLQIVWNLIS